MTINIWPTWSFSAKLCLPKFFNLTMCCVSLPFAGKTKNSRWVREIIWFRISTSTSTGSNMSGRGSTSRPANKGAVPNVSRRPRLSSHVQLVVHFAQLFGAHPSGTTPNNALDADSPSKSWRYVIHWGVKLVDHVKNVYRFAVVCLPRFSVFTCVNLMAKNQHGEYSI